MKCLVNVFKKNKILKILKKKNTEMWIKLEWRWSWVIKIEKYNLMKLKITKFKFSINEQKTYQGSTKDTR
jgi:hypothetical protein